MSQNAANASTQLAGETAATDAVVEDLGREHDQPGTDDHARNQRTSNAARGRESWSPRWWR